MVSRELDYSRIGLITENNLQSFLENNNPSYFQARQLYNSLSNNNLNPLSNGGIVANKDKFIIILLEKILRNTENLISQNSIIDNKILDLENLVSQSQNLEPIIIAGNKITEELNNWYSGFQIWNDKFKNFEKLFETWNIGFQQLETNIEKLETLLNNSFQY